MNFWSDAFRDGGRIPQKFALGRADPKTHVTFAENKNPPLAWSGLPAGTKSLALVVHDSEVPSRGDDVNKEGRTVPYELPRVEFFHWVLVDLAPEPARIEEGDFSIGITAKGKPGPEGPRGTRQGVNDYTGWFEADPDMGGTWFGYDGPGPPWNDTRLHRYHFTLYALDVPRCPVEGKFTGPDVRKAIEGHVLAKASFTGTYAIYADAR